MKKGLGATYRLQLRPGFGFREAAVVCGYLADLGIEVLYLSPVTESQPGSEHGYDVVDPTALRIELGGYAGFEALSAEAGRLGLGVLVDFVPHHLSTWAFGPWWGDVLRRGPESRHAEVFDIDWDAGGPEDRGKVALPVLDRPLAEVLANNEITIEMTGTGPILSYGGVHLPVVGPVRLDDNAAEVLRDQHYRLIPWRNPRARNYRRFLDVDDLVGVRLDDDEVFAKVHVLLGDLARRSWLSAVRVDHVDGLSDPGSYLGKLADLLGEVPIIVEKVLTGDEVLAIDWPVEGTTGYETIDDVSGVLVDPHGLERIVAAAVADGERSVDVVIRSAKRAAIEDRFPAELDHAALLLDAGRDELREAAIRLGVYRTYSEGEPGEPDSKREGRQLFEQLTAAVMVKGVEDMAWNRLSGPLAFCEVGGDPVRSRADGPARFLARCAQRVVDRQTGLVPGTTHDTKRSDDVRARLLSVTEMPDEFEAGLVRLAGLLPAAEMSDGVVVPDRLERRWLAQTLLSIAPLEPEGWSGLEERVGIAIRKTVRAAERRSSWIDPHLAYEEAIVEAATAALADRGAVLYRAFGDLLNEVARVGAVNSLAQVVLRSVQPGVPDCYQGDETWNYSLLEPDNRRPVDFAALSRSLASLTAVGSGDEPASFRRSWHDGRVKMLVTRQCLRARRAVPEAFAPDAGIAAADTMGGFAEHAFALIRRSHHEPDGDGSESPGGAEPRQAMAIAVVTRLARSLSAERGDLPVGHKAWRDTILVLPDDVPLNLVDGLTGRRHRAEPTLDGLVLGLGEVLGELPVAVLVGRT